MTSGPVGLIEGFYGPPWPWDVPAKQAGRQPRRNRVAEPLRRGQAGVDWRRRVEHGAVRRQHERVVGVRHLGSGDDVIELPGE